MMYSKKIIALASVMVPLLAGACTEMPPESWVLFGADYWERSNPTSALYLRGTQAQQRLHQDIARCTVEIRNLERVTSLRESIPADNRQGMPPDPATPEGRLAQWDSPERDGHLYFEHSDYHDFETCMMDAGWKRVDHLPYGVAEESKDVYVETVTGRR